tara:strand:- start:8541 stop:8975 length:435 start_codon:yes stop_codon:yes gene_type:complete
MKNVIVMGAFGIGYMALKRMLNRPAIFSGNVAERTDLIAWNPTLMKGMQQLSELVTEEELLKILDNLKEIRTVSKLSDRTSTWRLQRLVASTTRDIIHVAGRTRGSMTTAELQTQNSILEDVIPSMDEILQNIQHNHMLDSLCI